MITRSLVVAALIVVGGSSAPATDQTVQGTQLQVKNPSTVEKRKIVVKAKEEVTDDTVVGDPTANGATLTISVNGGTPSSQAFNLPAGISTMTQKPFWSGDVTKGFKYKDSKGENGPVKGVQIKRSAGGVFQIRAMIAGKLGDISVLPPNPGTDGCALLAIEGGDSYSVEFAGGTITNVGANLFKLSKPTVEGVCGAPPCVLLAKWGSFGSANGEFDDPQDVAVDGSGNVYVADRLNNRIQKFTSGGSFVTKWGSTGSGNGEFSGLGGVAVDGSGQVYVSDEMNNRIQKFTSGGTFVTKWGSAGSADGQFITPGELAVDGSGNVYVPDYGNGRIQKFTSGGGFLTKWGTIGSGNGQFDGPVAVAVDGSANVYVVDANNSRIQEFTSGGTFITKWGAAGGGPGEFNFIFGGNAEGGIAVDASGNVYVADYGNDRIQKFTSSGGFLREWGFVGSGDGQFMGPSGLDVDGAGNVYVADSGDNDRIQKFACP